MSVEMKTDPAEVCEAALEYVEQGYTVEGALSLGGFGSDHPYRDCPTEPGVWSAYVRALGVVKTMNRSNGADHRWGGMGDNWPPDSTIAQRKATLRKAARWIRSQPAIDYPDGIQVTQERPGRYRARKEGSYLRSFMKPTAAEAIADLMVLYQRHLDREAFKAGDERFEEVTHRACGVAYTTVHRKENVR